MSFGYQILGFGSGGGAGPFPVATGGTITTVSTDYKLHTFTADGQFIFTAGTDPTYGTKVEFLLVGGGAGGAGSHGGGGGGGGYYYNTGIQHTLSSGTYAVDIGAGGAGGGGDAGARNIPRHPHAVLFSPAHHELRSSSSVVSTARRTRTCGR